MINKKHFGKRISYFRRRIPLSQAELAEKMGVSAQAVSKWETGMALPDVELLLELSGLCGVSVNELLLDNALLARLSGRSFETRNGIAYFVPGSEEKEWAREMREEGWIERNWRDAWDQPGGWAESKYGGSRLMERSRPDNLRVGRKIAERGGIILEIGTGPGGGYMPFILQAAPASQIILSDLSHTVVEEWKCFLDRELDSPYLRYAVLDFCEIPFDDCTVDVVSDHGGIINCIGDRSAALPEHAQQELLDKYPEAFDNLYEDTVLAGFQKMDSVVQGVWYTGEDDSGIADLARKLGVNVPFTEYVRFCEK